MYNNIKTRHRGMSRGSSTSRRSGRGGFGGGRKNSAGVNPTVYVNKAAELTEEAPYQAAHRFSDFGLNQLLLERLAARGYQTPTPIQDEAIPVALTGRDVIGIAETGTGKTAAFLLPLLNKVCQNPRERVLIIAPTRELAVQIDDELRLFSAGLPIRSAICIGGMGFGAQLKALARSPQFIIGTPGRLKDHLRQRTLRLNDVANLVLDEADRMVEMGFIEDIRSLISELPTERQSLFFSATVMPEVRGLIDSFMRSPATISVKKRDTAANVDQDVIHYAGAFQKLTLLCDLLAKEEFSRVLIFGRTKRGVEKLSESLAERGFKSISIHGNKNQSQRQRALQDFKDGRVHILVATDVAARGLDIPDVSHVINFDTPENYADYIHRIGRTGRANKKGHALTFVSQL